MKLFKVALLLTACALFALPSFAVTLNEIRIDQPGGDDEEFVELMGMPGESLDGLTLIVIGDGTGNAPIEAVVPFDGLAIGADGYFLATEATWDSDPLYTTCEDDIDHMFTGYELDFENGDDTTFLLVMDFTGVEGDDVDVDGDGVMDFTPWAYIVDEVSIDSPYEARALFSTNIVGPDGSYAPGAIAICDGMWVVSLYDLCLSDTPGFANSAGCTVPTADINLEGLKAMYR